METFGKLILLFIKPLTSWIMKLLGVWTYKTHLNEMLFLWDSQFHYTNTLYKLLHFIILHIKQLNSCATSSDILMTCYIVLSILYLILFVCIAYYIYRLTFAYLINYKPSAYSAIWYLSLIQFHFQLVSSLNINLGKCDCTIV